MSTLTILGIAVALAMDAFAVSIAAGVYLRSVGLRHYFRLGWHFGLFQALMPVLGWYAGLSVRGLIESYDHWVAFGLLAFVSFNMFREAFDAGENRSKTDPSRGLRLVLLSVATSIDALAVGLSLSVLKISVWGPAAVIGVTAAAFTVTGLMLGSRAGNILWLRRYTDLAGAGVLLFIGLRILYEHGSLAFVF
ncbi:MAG: manganese efflux pump MntP family protein [Thermodesulfobacteriota bacterium]